MLMAMSEIQRIFVETRPAQLPCNLSISAQVGVYNTKNYERKNGFFPSIHVERIFALPRLAGNRLWLYFFLSF